jgi:hypothetical protein
VDSNLESLARRVEDDPFFLGSVLTHYARTEGYGDEQLSKALGCTTDTLALLRLCRAPEGDQVGKAIREISDRFEVNADALAVAIRTGQAIMQLRRAGTGGSTLAAARDRNMDGKDQP